MRHFLIVSLLLVAAANVVHAQAPPKARPMELKVVRMSIQPSAASADGTDRRQRCDTLLRGDSTGTQQGRLGKDYQQMARDAARGSAARGGPAHACQVYRVPETP